MVTIEDVAQKAGVSVATVSRVLNNEFLVTREKIEKVKAAISELGYVPNALRRRSPAKTKTNIVLVVTSDIVDDMLSGISDAAKLRGYNVMLDYVSSKVVDTESIMRYLDNGIVDGIILINYYSNIAEIEQINEKYPLVQCGNFLRLNNAFLVSINDEQAAYELTSHLIEIGKNRIAFSTMDLDAPFVIERKKGYLRALCEHHLEYDPGLVIYTDHSIEGGEEVARRMMAMTPPADAVICLFDLTAYGCYKELKKMKVQMPSQAAMACFDVGYSELVEPEITSIVQPFYQIGSESMRTLQDIITGKLNDGRRIYLNHELIVRKTTAIDDAP